MPPLVIAAAVSGGLGLVGGALNKPKASNERQSDNTPFFDPAFRGLQNSLIQNALSGLDQGLPDGFEERGVSAINDTFEVGSQSLENDFLRRGLSGSGGAAGGRARFQLGRLGSIGKFRSEIPLHEQAARERGFNRALNTFNSRTQGPGSTTTTGVSTGGGGGFGAGAGTAAELIAFMIGQGAFGGGGNDPDGLDLLN